MKIRVLGTRGEIEPSLPYHSRHSGVLLDSLLLLDLGEQEFLEYNPSAVLVTHLHPDHAFFITHPASLDVPVYAPQPDGLSIIPVSAGETFRLGAHQITPVPTHHSLKVDSMAYVIAHGGQKLLYTGDMIWINKEYHHLLNDLDLVITEGSYLRKGGMVRRDKATGRLWGHTGIPDLVRLFKTFTSNILLTHFGKWFFKDTRTARRKLADLAKQNGVNLMVGYDGLELDISSLCGR